MISCCSALVVFLLVLLSSVNEEEELEEDEVKVEEIEEVEEEEETAVGLVTGTGLCTTTTAGSEVVPLAAKTAGGWCKLGGCEDT